ncbi:MAG: DUF1697 domain-containing protein [Thermoleophilia bacterium]
MCALRYSQLAGTVTVIKEGAVGAQVTLDIAGQSITAVITTDAVSARAVPTCLGRSWRCSSRGRGRWAVQAEEAVTLVGLIRGINVGRAKRVAMADLRSLVTGLGYTDVRTLLNSGNVVFSAPGDAASSTAAKGANRGPAGTPRVAADSTSGVPSAEVGAQLETALADQLGVAARIVVITAAELDEVVAGNRLSPVALDPSRLLVAFVADPAHLSRLEPLIEREWAPEALAVGGRAAYLWCPDGVATSPLVKAVGEALGDAVTMRNWATVLKLQHLTGLGGSLS